MLRPLYSLMAALSLTAALAACADNPAATAPTSHSAPAEPSLSVSLGPVSADPSALTFGGVLWHQSRIDTVTITNSGKETINTGLAITGPDAIDFNMFSVNGEMPDCGWWLTPGLSCVIGVQFTPQAVGQRVASLDITVPGIGVLSVGLFGEGVRGAVLYGPDSMSFAEQTVGTTSSAQTVMIRNIGTANMNVRGVSFLGSNPSDFAVTQASTNACVLYAPIAPNASCNIGVAFAPKAAGARSGEMIVYIADGAGSLPAASVLLDGTGTEIVSNPGADLAVSFGGMPSQIQVGKTLTYAITVKNGGPGTASGIALSAAVPAGTGFAGLTAPTGVSCSSPLKGDTGGVTCSISSMASGSAYTVKLAVTTLSGNRTVISNAATVTSTSVDPVKANDSATATTTVVGKK